MYHPDIKKYKLRKNVHQSRRPIYKDDAMSKKIRLGYDILSKRAIETESGVNIDDALRSISSYQKVPGVGIDNHPDVSRPSTKILYIVKVASAGQPDTYKEWIWTQPSDGQGYWECTGDTSQDLSVYALKSEMSVVPGTGADADKTTITLKEGTSATVLTAHQGLGDYVSVNQQSFNTTQKSIARGNIGAAEDTAVQSVKIGNGTELNDGTNVVIPLATDVSNGAMSGTDKAKLDAIASGAQVNVIEHVNAGQTELVPVNKTVTIPYAEAIVPSHTVVIGGRTYRTVTMPDGKEWLAENLDYKFDGCFVGTNYDWSQNTKTPLAMYYRGDETTYGSTGKNYGLLYNFNAASLLDTNKATLLPSGWRVPTRQDWASLVTSLGENPGTKIKATSWNGSDDYGMSVLPAGQYCDEWNDSCAYFWTSTAYIEYSAYYRYMSSSNSEISETYHHIGYAYSIRLVNDTTVDPTPTYNGGLITPAMVESLSKIDFDFDSTTGTLNLNLG